MHDRRVPHAAGTESVRGAPVSNLGRCSCGKHYFHYALRVYFETREHGVPFTEEAKRCMAKYTSNVRRRTSELFVPNCSYPGSTVIDRLLSGAR